MPRRSSHSKSRDPRAVNKTRGACPSHGWVTAGKTRQCPQCGQPLLAAAEYAALCAARNKARLE